VNNFEIKTTLSVCPSRIQNTHNIIYITKGASATLNFNLTNKLYNLIDIDQLMFVLKHKDGLNWYKLFTYLVRSTDQEVVPGKTYYENVLPLEEDTFQCTGSIVIAPEGNPAENGYYEETSEACSWRDTYYIIDSHFVLNNVDKYEYVTLLLSSSETASLPLTSIDTPMDFEIDIRLNTDIFSSLNNKDSIIIEPQHYIAVVDSLYSHI
jgi:hypothetical protein